MGSFLALTVWDFGYNVFTQIFHEDMFVFF